MYSYNTYTRGLAQETLGGSFEGELSEIDFFRNIRNGTSYLIDLDVMSLPIMVLTHRVINVSGQNIIIGDYFWIKEENRGNGAFIQETFEHLKANTSSELLLMTSLSEYLETYKHLIGAIEMKSGVIIV